MALNVIRSFTDKLWIIVKPADGLVAMGAEQPANFSSRMAVVNGKAFGGPSYNMPLRSLANGADVILSGEHGIILGFRDCVFFKSVFEPAANYADQPFFGMPVTIRRGFRALFTRGLQAIRSFFAVFVELRNRLSHTALTARLCHAVTDRPSVLGMMRIVWHRFTLDPASLGSGFRCNRGNLAAAAVAKMVFAHGECYNTEKV